MLSVMCDSDSVCRIAVAKKRKLATARGMSRERASEIGLPVSIDSARANFSRSRSIKSATRKRIFERSTAGFVDQSANAFSAAATARSTSRASLSATCDYGSSRKYVRAQNPTFNEEKLFWLEDRILI